MIMYTNNISDLELIPEAYLVLVVSGNDKEIQHGNYKRLPMQPDENSGLGKEKAKEKFFKKLKKEYNNEITIIMHYAYFHQHSNSLVIFGDKKDKTIYGFNVAKAICEYIENRYEYKTFKFTNCITKDMREQSVISKTGHKLFLVDMKGLRDAIQSDKTQLS